MTQDFFKESVLKHVKELQWVLRNPYLLSPLEKFDQPQVDFTELHFLRAYDFFCNVVGFFINTAQFHHFFRRKVAENNRRRPNSKILKQPSGPILFLRHLESEFIVVFPDVRNSMRKHASFAEQTLLALQKVLLAELWLWFLVSCGDSFQT